MENTILKSLIWPNIFFTLALQIGNMILLFHEFEFFRRIFIFLNPMAIVRMVVRRVIAFLSRTGRSISQVVSKVTKKIYYFVKKIIIQAASNKYIDSRFSSCFVLRDFKFHLNQKEPLYDAIVALLRELWKLTSFLRLIFTSIRRFFTFVNKNIRFFQ